MLMTVLSNEISSWRSHITECERKDKKEKKRLWYPLIISYEMIVLILSSQDRGGGQGCRGGPRKAIVPVCQGPLTRFSCPPAALAVAMATVALRNIAIPPLPPPSWAILPHMKLYPEAPHRLGGSAPCTAELEGRSVGSVSSTDSTPNPGSVHP